MPFALQGTPTPTGEFATPETGFEPGITLAAYATCTNIRFRGLVLNPREAPQTHVWGASLLSEPQRRGLWFSGVARRRSGVVAEEVSEEVAERPSAQARNGRRGDQEAQCAT